MRGKSVAPALAVALTAAVAVAPRTAPAAGPAAMPAVLRAPAGNRVDGMTVSDGRSIGLQFLPGAFWKSGVPSDDRQR